MTKKQAQHRGRIQAQGGGIEISEAWAQEDPLTLEEGLEKLELLKNNLNGVQRLYRRQAFENAERFMRQAERNGGVGHTVIKTFDGLNGTRVDIEVRKGLAFVPK